MSRLRPCAALLAALVLIPASPASARDWPLISQLTSDLSDIPGAVAAGPDGSVWMSEPANPGRVARFDADGTLTEVAAGIPGFNKDKAPTGMIAGPDGRMWFLQKGLDAVARVTAAGQVDQLPALPVSGVQDLALGADGSVWVTATGGAGQIARITANGTVKHDLPAGPDPAAITAGPDGAMWFTQPGLPGAIGRISAAGVVQRFTSGLTSAPSDIAAGPDGALWFTEATGIGRITPDGTITEYSRDLNPTRTPRTIAAGPDGALWFTEGGVTPAIGRITVDGTIDEFTIGLARLFDPAAIAAGTDGGMIYTSGAAGALAHITVPPATGATTASATAYDGASFSATVRPNGQLTTYRFEVSDAGGTLRRTAEVGAGNGLDPVTVAAAVTGLAPATTYTVRVVATNDSGVSQGVVATFTTPALPLPAPRPSGSDAAQPTPDAAGTGTVTDAGPAPATGATDPVTVAAVPTLGKSVVAQAAKGAVTVKVPGQDGFVALSTLSTLPVGSVVDATQGAVSLRSALDASGRSQTGTFRGGRFKVAQARSGRGMTDLLLRGGDFSSCTTTARATGPATASRVLATASRKKRAPTVRRLWGKDSGGRFRTHGRDSVATVRGTEWLTVDRCDGSRTTVRSGAVQVRDRATGRTVLVRAGHSHLAAHVR